MRIKPTEALKARRSRAQGGGREAAVTLGWHEKDTSPERAAQPASPLQGLTLIIFRNPGFQRTLPVLFRPKLCRRIP